MGNTVDGISKTGAEHLASLRDGRADWAAAAALVDLLLEGFGPEVSVAP